MLQVLIILMSSLPMQSADVPPKPPPGEYDYRLFYTKDGNYEWRRKIRPRRPRDYSTASPGYQDQGGSYSEGPAAPFRFEHKWRGGYVTQALWFLVLPVCLIAAVLLIYAAVAPEVRRQAVTASSPSSIPIHEALSEADPFEAEPFEPTRPVECPRCLRRNTSTATRCAECDTLLDAPTPEAPAETISVEPTRPVECPKCLRRNASTATQCAECDTLLGILPDLSATPLLGLTTISKLPAWIKRVGPSRPVECPHCLRRNTSAAVNCFECGSVLVSVSNQPRTENGPAGGAEFGVPSLEILTV